MLNDQPPIANTLSGKVRGIRLGEVQLFRGIPYAQATRFKAPIPHEGWKGIRDATGTGAICPQRPSRLALIMGEPKDVLKQSEECQLLTIATLGLEGRRPVMVWIHGGAYVTGGGEFACYSPQRLVAEHDVVVVSISYRLGAFGYVTIDGGERNCGLLDQVKALQWVRNNIEHFGGDPTNITVFGHSAGGHSIFSMITLYPELNLFERAIIQSAPLGMRASPSDESRRTTAFLSHLKKDPWQATVGEILTAQSAFIRASKRPMPFRPIFDQRFEGGMVKPIDLIVGWTRDDVAPFIALQKIGRKGRPLRYSGICDRVVNSLITNYLFKAPARRFATSIVAKGKNSYVYRFDLRPPMGILGAAHCLEIPFLLGDEECWRGAPIVGAMTWSEIEFLGRKIRSAWASFARSGNPNSEGSWEWRPITHRCQPILYIQ